MSKTHLGAKLQALRRHRGITQQQLAQEAGVSLSTVSKLEEGSVTRPSARILLKLMGVLKFDLDELLNEKPLPESIRPAKRPRTKLTDIEFVYFDIGGVLAHTESIILQKISSQLNRNLDQVKAVYYQYVPLAHKGKLSLADLQLLFMFKLNLPFKGENKKRLFRDWVEYIKPNLPAHEFAAEVAKRYPIGLLTNIFGGGFYERMLRAGQVPNLPYKAVVQSADIGFIKPEAEIYKIAAEKVGADPAKILFIDDRRINVTAARAAGWKAEWFNELKTEASIQRIRRRYFN